MRFLIILFAVFLGAQDYAALYNQKCAICHGANGNAVYLGKVPPIINLEYNERYNALKAYKESERNKYRLGGIMVASMKEIRSKHIKGLNDYINILKTEVVKECKPSQIGGK